MWDRSLRECSLETVLDSLCSHEISVGLQSFADGWTAWIGDNINSRRCEATFDRLSPIPEWLVVNAEALYPRLRAA